MREKFVRMRRGPALFLSAALLIAATGCEKKNEDNGEKKSASPEKKEAKASSAAEKKNAPMIYGIGYVRGSSQTTLKNKYAGFVTKVHFYSQARVKKGDVILEYDDHELRTKILKAKNTILELEKDLHRRKLDLEIKKLDPLPSDYRNILWKEFAAEQLQKRLQHETNVYKRLYAQRCISELDYLRKQEEYHSATADFKRLVQDKERVSGGLDKLHIQAVEKDIEALELEIANRKAELALLEEEKKYYRIAAPFDGVCITNSDTVNGYDAAGTAAASVHKDKRKIIYAYFDEADVGFIREGMKGRFRSNQYGLKHGYFSVTPYEVKKNRTTYGDKCFFLVKFRIDEEHHPLRIESSGRVELFVEQE
ncbi:MAG: hypothetical protein J6A21_04435 [Lentisphaeria bacterium]|nr:hypothetical protein [Lentisphaeria bacterium]